MDEISTQCLSDGTIIVNDKADGFPLIYKQLPKAAEKIGSITKDKRNTQQGYNFRGIDDVLNSPRCLTIITLMSPSVTGPPPYSLGAAASASMLAR